MTEAGQLLDLEQAKPVLAQWARNNPFIGELRIFGSYAKGQATPDSDLDIAIRIVQKKPGDTNFFTTYQFESPAWEQELSILVHARVDLEDIVAKHVSQYVEEASILVYYDIYKSAR